MKIISFILLFIMTSNTFAGTGVIQELERQIDEYNYAITVEWDQKDKAFYEKETAEFKKRLDGLYQEKGLSTQDMMLVLEKRVQDKKLLEALKLKSSLMDRSMTPSDLLEELKKEGLYSKGASWNGDTTLWIIGGVVVVALAIMMAHNNWWDENHVCTKYDEAEECVDEYDCRGEICSYDGTYCSMITRCTKYERK